MLTNDFVTSLTQKPHLAMNKKISMQILCIYIRYI
jgi:hypothetical protein